MTGKATARAEQVRAIRREKREAERKRKDYVERTARLKAEVAAGGRTSAPRVAHVKVKNDVVSAPTVSQEASPSTRAEGQGGLPPERDAEQPGLGRVRTFVPGFDEALGGGIPRNHVVIIEGSPGTMKSSLGFWILAHNCMRDRRRALYISCEENTASLLQQMEGLGIDLPALEDHVKILDPPLLRRAMQKERRGDWLAAFQAAVAGAAKGECDLLVIDSLDALEVLAKLEDRRRELFRLFEWLRDLGMTTFVIAERPDYVVGGNVFLGRYDEDFLADGVLHLRLHLLEEDAQRRIRIVKMRGTRHETGYLALHASRGEFEVSRVLSG